MFLKNRDRDYWIRKFYEGSLLIPGWNSVKAEILEAVAPADRLRISQMLDALGNRISQEWARDNDDRAITSSHLTAWGQRMKDARTRGTEDLIDTLETIDREVSDLLSQ